MALSGPRHTAMGQKDQDMLPQHPQDQDMLQ